MNPFRRTILLCVSLILILVAASPAPAQAPASSIDPSRLPPHTVFYVLWRGAPAPAARSANSLYALWDDPDFAPARNALFDSFMKDARKSGDAKSQFSREEISEFTTLLENPMSLGFVSDPAKDKPKSVSLIAPGAAKAVPPKTDDAHKWNGFFFIYDRTGKEALLAKALLRFRAAEQFPPKLTPTMIAGVPAMKVEHKSETEYWVENGKYVVTSGEVSVIEQILSHMKSDSLASKSLITPEQAAEMEKILARTKSGVPPPTSLGAVSAFKEASAVLGGGILEYFVNISDITKLAADMPTPAGFRAGTVLDAMKVNAIHSIAGRVVLDGDKTRFQTSILGSTSAGTIFDIWDAGQANPASIAYIPPNAISYREAQLNFPGIYALAMRVAKSFTAQGDDKTDMIEAMARAKLGMSTADALDSLTGELGYVQTDSAFDLGKNTFFIGVHNRENALKLIRHIFLDNISADIDIDGDTLLTLSTGKKQGTPNPAAETNFHLAVTKDMILVASKKDSLRVPLAQRKSSTPPSQLAPFFANRSGAPAAVNGLSFLDFQKFDWQSLKNLPFGNTAGDKSVAKSLSQNKITPAQQKSWLDEIDPKVFSRHLHLGYGYSWKDANGIHFDGWFD
ncbi:MAG TPA: hypothetical protein VN025_17370 [Candidatus Dormibacteraeota bacterium]|jgi:hypothetical protein|nr:hypothetical protein [Candidatus Dormibacteraeota bacterium]